MQGSIEEATTVFFCSSYKTIYFMFMTLVSVDRMSIHSIYNVRTHICHHRLNFIATTIIIFIMITRRKRDFDTFIAHVPFFIDQNCYTYNFTLYTI